MRTFLFISEKGASFSVAYKLFAEENRVIFFCNKSQKIGSGYLEAPKNQELQSLLSYIPKLDAVIFDFPFIDSSVLASKFREAGVPTFGTSQLEENLYNSSEYQYKFLRAHGLNVPKGYILEPDSTAFVSVKASVVFSGGRVVQVFYSFDAVGLMNDNIGLPVTMGSACRIGRVEDRLFSDGISVVLGSLSKAAFSGQISISFLVTRNSLFATGLEVGLFQPHMFGVLDGRKFNLENILIALALNNLSKFPLRPEWCLAVRFAVAPFPYPVNGHYPEEFKIKGLNEGNLKHIWFEDVYFKDGYSCARSSGALGFVTARGVQVREARRRAYRTVRDLGIPYPLYRTDVGSRASWEYPLLEEWGWIKHT